MRDAVLLDERQELAEVGPRHDDDLAAERHHREAEHSCGMRERSHRQVPRPTGERVAHQRQRRHRLHVATGQPHALRPPRRAAGADEDDDVVRRLEPVVGHVAIARRIEPRVQRRITLASPVEAHERGQPWQRIADLGDQRSEGGLVQEHRAPEQVEQLPVLLGLVARVHRAPHRPGAGDAVDAGERRRVVGRQHGHRVAGAGARAHQRPGHPSAELPAPRRRTSIVRRRSGTGRPHPGRRPCRGNRPGSSTTPLRTPCRRRRRGRCR